MASGPLRRPLLCAYLSGANLVNADLMWTNPIRADLRGANLANVNLFRAYLSGADLKDCKGLTQNQLNQTSVRKKAKPPNLDGAYDAETGDLLKRRGDESIRMS